MQDAIQQQTQTTTRPHTLQMTQLPGQRFILPSRTFRNYTEVEKSSASWCFTIQTVWKRVEKSHHPSPEIHPVPQKKTVPQVKILDYVTIQKKKKNTYLQELHVALSFFLCTLVNYRYEWIIVQRLAVVFCVHDEDKTDGNESENNKCHV